MEINDTNFHDTFWWIMILTTNSPPTHPHPAKLQPFNWMKAHWLDIFSGNSVVTIITDHTSLKVRVLTLQPRGSVRFSCGLSDRRNTRLEPFEPCRYIYKLIMYWINTCHWYSESIQATDIQNLWFPTMYHGVVHLKDNSNLVSGMYAHAFLRIRSWI